MTTYSNFIQIYEVLYDATESKVLVKLFKKMGEPT